MSTFTNLIPFKLGQLMSEMWVSMSSSLGFDMEHHADLGLHRGAQERPPSGPNAASPLAATLEVCVSDLGLVNWSVEIAQNLHELIDMNDITIVHGIHRPLLFHSLDFCSASKSRLLRGGRASELHTSEESCSFCGLVVLTKLPRSGESDFCGQFFEIFGPSWSIWLVVTGT